MITPLVIDLVNVILFFVFTRLVNTPAPLSICLPLYYNYNTCSIRLLPCALGMDITPTGLSSLRLLNRGMLSLA
jgi:hypothetical protein